MSNYNIPLELASSLMFRFANLDKFNEKLVTVSIPNESKIYIENLYSWYTLTSRHNGDVEDDCIFVETNRKLIPCPSSDNKINIKCFGAIESNRDTASKVLKAIKYCMNHGNILFVPSGIFYVTEEIEITKPLMIEGASTFGLQHLGSRIKFDPKDKGKTLFTDNGMHSVSIKHVNFICDYTVQSIPNWTEPKTSPSDHYLSWNYTYTDVNCFKLPHSYLYIDDVTILGFSGFGLEARAALRLHKVSIIHCKYGFYNCRTDSSYDEPTIQHCEHGWHWDNGGAVVLVNNMFCDQCKYAFYSYNDEGKGTLTGVITGEIDHCLYAAIYAIESTGGLTVRGRIRRCGLYYLGTDMSTKVPTVWSTEAFDDMSKGVFFAICWGRVFLDIDTDEWVVTDNGTGTMKTPTVLAFGQNWSKAVINTLGDFGDKTLICTRKDKTNVTIINHNSMSQWQK